MKSVFLIDLEWNFIALFEDLFIELRGLSDYQPLHLLMVSGKLLGHPVILLHDSIGAY